VEWLRTLGAPAVACALMPVSGSLVPALAVGTAVYLAAFVAVEAVVDPGDLRFVGNLLARRLPGRAPVCRRAWPDRGRPGRATRRAVA
jgi:hypothetical protein